MTNLGLFLLADRVSHPVSVRSDSIDVSLVAPVTIRAASSEYFQVHLIRILCNYSRRYQHIL